MDALPIAWVDRIFDKLAITYGKAFSNQYEGLSTDTVKGNWATELGRYAKRPDAIKWALENLPAKPPNVVEFRNLCRDAPNPDVIKLPPPTRTPMPEKVAEAFSVLFKGKPGDGKGWAQSILDRHERGEKVSCTALRMAKEAMQREGVKHEQE